MNKDTFLEAQYKASTEEEAWEAQRLEREARQHLESSSGVGFEKVSDVLAAINLQKESFDKVNAELNNIYEDELAAIN